MASRQFLRRMSPLLRSSLRLAPVMRSALHLPRQAVLSQNLAARLSGVRLMSTDADSNIINIQSEEDFEKRVNGPTPVIVDFHATWCGPCKLLGPRLETIVSEMKGKVIMVKVDIDDLQELAMNYKIQSVPTVYGMKNGNVEAKFVGLKDDDEIRDFINGLL